MKFKATVVCKYSDSKLSTAIAKSLHPDNLGIPSGQIKTVQEGEKVITTVVLNGRIETLLNTLDDLLACTHAAESVLNEEKFP